MKTFVTCFVALLPAETKRCIFQFCKVTFNTWNSNGLLRGSVDDLSFFDYFSPFCFLSIEFHFTFSISYKLLLYLVYYYCI